MKIKVLGKAHLKGTSKRTNNFYDFNQVHYLGYDPRVEGQAARRGLRYRSHTAEWNKQPSIL